MERLTDDYYEFIGVKKDATNDVIKEACNKLLMKYHPDRNKVVYADRITQHICEIKDVLLDSDKRKAYDLTLLGNKDNPQSETTKDDTQKQYTKTSTCDVCGTSLDSPFVCSGCKGKFCLFHSTPNSHNCSYSAQPKTKGYTKTTQKTQATNTNKQGASISDWIYAIARWFFGIFFILAGIGSNNYVSGIFYLLAGLISIPFSANRIEKLLHIRISGVTSAVTRFVVVFIFLYIAGSSINATDASLAASNNTTVSVDSVSNVADTPTALLGNYEMTCNIIDIGGRGVSDIEKIGDVVTYNVTLKNTGNAPLNITSLTIKPQGNNISYPINTIDLNVLDSTGKNAFSSTSNVLGTNQLWTYTGTYTVTPDDFYQTLGKNFILTESTAEYTDESVSTHSVPAFARCDYKYKYDYNTIYPQNGKVIYVRGDNNSVVLHHNESAIDITFSQLMDYLRSDDIYSIAAIPSSDTYTSGDRMQALYNNAETAGINATFVVLGLEQGDLVACLLFHTTDKGDVYIDYAEGGFTLSTNLQVGEYASFTRVGGSAQYTSQYKITSVDDY